jgi:hypothetical protein
MTPPQIGTAFSERIFPLLQELGCEGCVVTGYLSNGEGRLGKFSIMMGNRGNAAIEDGMAPLAAFSSMWCSPPKEFGPPSESSAEPPLGGNG